MSLFKRNRQMDEADLIYEEARKRAYAREVKRIAAAKGYKAGQQLAANKFNQPQSTGYGLLDGIQKHRGRLEAIANADWVGVNSENMPIFRKPNQKSS